MRTMLRWKGWACSFMSRAKSQFRESDVSRRFNEGREFGVRHGMDVHVEAIDHHFVGRRFFQEVMIRPHDERAARNPDHLRG
ncbi:hypothetical protein IP90_01651 [Luteimonas cucumeris]|uniref:Uncharacterized protein n=1 Tax=Luteimonas cucumeris TaxID=985012 RepID=A0A562L8B9_9GAMM|nr:hypothetical protein IP90_01651 [Luteimonas cucumeris]